MTRASVKSRAVRDGLKPGDRRLAVRADGRLHEDGARRVDAERLVNRDRLGQLAREDRQVRLPDPPVLHRRLKEARRTGILRQHDDPARLAVEPEDQVMVARA